MFREAPPVQHTGNGWYHLSSVLQAALILDALALAVSGATSVWGAVTISSWLDSPVEHEYDTRRFFGLHSLLTLGGWLLGIVTVVLFICWLYQAYSRPLAERKALRMRRGWAIGGWFIPFAGYVIPYRVVQGVNCATFSPPRRDSPWIRGWWASYLLFTFITFLSVSHTPDAANLYGSQLLHEVRTTEILSAVSGAVGIVAALLAALVVFKVTARVQAVAMRESSTR
jgi:hypothetical protein